MIRNYDADAILWNWARWCNSGAKVGNMADYVPYEDEFRPICIEQAQEVDRLHQRLSHPQRMVIIAEYPQRNGRFRGLRAEVRAEKARRWIHTVTGAWLLDAEYQRDLTVFKQRVEERLL